MNKLPIARSTDIVVQALGKEVLIYDLNIHKAYNLNETSGIVYQACDGKTTFDELRIKHSFTDELIFLALDELKKENLIEDYKSLVSPFNGMSRREAIRKVGLASMIALPVISSLVAPTAAMAQSACVEQQGACTSSAQCCSSAPNCNNFLGDSRCCTGTGALPSRGRVASSASGTCATSTCDNTGRSARCCSGSSTLVSCVDDANNPGNIFIVCNCD